MSGTGYPHAYAYAQTPHTDLSYPEFPGRVSSIPQTTRIPSLPLPVPLPTLPLPMVPLSMQQPPPLPPPAPHRLPSIPQSMQLPSIPRVTSIPSIPTPHRPLTMQPTTSLSMVDPLHQQSWGYWPGAAYEPAYQVSAGGYVLPGYGYSVGPPMHLYQQTRGGSLGGMEMTGAEGGGGVPMMVDIGGGQMMPMIPSHMQPLQPQVPGPMAPMAPTRLTSGPSATKAAQPPAPSTGEAAGGRGRRNSGAERERERGSAGLNVRVSPPPFDRNAAPSASYHAYPQFSSDPSFRSSTSSSSSSSSSSPPASLDAATFHHNIRSLTASTARLLCLPVDDHSQSVLFVHSYQYMQILKRREQRKNDTRKRIKSKHKSRQAHAARRVRGSGGRFLTKEEKAMLGFSSRP